MLKDMVKKKLMIRKVLGLLAIALSLALLSGTGWAQPLSAFTVPQPVFLDPLSLHGRFPFHPFRAKNSYRLNYPTATEANTADRSASRL